MKERILEIGNIDVGYGDVRVLTQVSLDVKEGEVVTVIGPNGTGKSTLLNTVMGFLHPSRGSIQFRGSPIGALPPEAVVQLGLTIVPEGARVFSGMTVLDNLKMGSYVKAARKFREDSLEIVFSFFPRLKERAEQPAGTLSGGERQMLAIGRALMSRPLLLLLDEPSLGLAPILVSRVFEAISEIVATGITVLLVEQNVHYSLEIAQRCYVMENGRISKEGRSEDILRDDHVRKAYLAI